MHIEKWGSEPFHYRDSCDARLSCVSLDFVEEGRGEGNGEGNCRDEMVVGC